MEPLPRHENLFIVDSSIWVTSDSVNPTSAIQALALYAADCIKKRLTNLFDWGRVKIAFQISEPGSFLALR